MHGDTQYSVNKQTNNILNLTPSGDRNYQLILAAHRRFFLEENNIRFSLCFLLTIILSEQFIGPKKCQLQVSKKYVKKVSKKLSTKSATKTVHKKCLNKVSTTSVHNKCS